MQKSIHILRYGTVADKVHLENAIDTYDYLSINGNTAAYVSKAIAKFVVEKFFTNTNKGFFIDPITYAFQSNIHLLYSKPKKGLTPKIKKSILKLIEYYGEPTNKVVSGSSINTSDFADATIVETFCRQVLEFQYSVIRNYITENDLEKYLLYAANIESLDMANQLRPKFLIAPYFYIDSNDTSYKEWLVINKKLIELSKRFSKQFYNNIPIFAQIVVSKSSLINSIALDEIVTFYKNINCDGYTIWIDGLNEHEADSELLIGMVNLLKRLHGKPVYNMYGGYFSILLTHKSIDLLSGVSHGMEYGESRAVYPVGGGIPVSKYYYMPIHQRIDFTKAFYMLEHEGILDRSLSDWGDCKKYYNEICGCPQCKGIMKDAMINFLDFESTEFYQYICKNQIVRRKKASTETKINCLYHYLLCKKMEFGRVGKYELSHLLSSLSSEKMKYEDGQFLEENELDYLEIWYNVLQSYC